MREWFEQLPINTNQQIIRCECGLEILLIPDLREMGSVIDVHAQEHGKKQESPQKAKATIERIQNLLIKQVMEKAQKSKLPQK